MSLHPRWHRRALALWAGLVPAWGAVFVVALIRYPDIHTRIAVVATVVGIVAGALLTWRLREQDDEPFISVEDLRKQ